MITEIKLQGSTVAARSMSYQDDSRRGQKRQREEDIIDAKQALISLIFKAGDVPQVLQ